MNRGDPLSWLDELESRRKEQGLDRHLVARNAASAGWIEHDGRRLVNFASNDYLGLAADPRLTEAAVLAARTHGWGAGASALVSGWREPHEELARALARFEGSESAILFPTGYAANIGTIAALVGSGDAVYGDRLNHSCLVQGARLSGASLRVYPHCDADRLDAILARERTRFRRVLIATDGVFSMDGDIAPVDELVRIAEEYEAILLVDEAHGTGVFGPDGRGACSFHGVAQRVPVRVGTLSKALGSIGGFVAGSRRLVQHLINTAPTLVYSTALPPAAAAAAQVALEIAQKESWRRQRVLQLSRTLRAQLGQGGMPVAQSVGPIVPVILGEASVAVAASKRLMELGFLVPAIRPPTVPRGTARLRISLSAAHGDDDPERLSDALQAI